MPTALRMAYLLLGTAVLVGWMVWLIWLLHQPSSHADVAAARQADNGLLALVAIAFFGPPSLGIYLLAKAALG